jgi:hypothetical protein
MAELPLDADRANALSGTVDVETGVPYPTIGESPYYTSFFRMQYRWLDAARRANDLRVFKDGDLTFGVRAGRYYDAGTWRIFAGAAGQGLSDDTSNYIYLDSAGAVQVATSGFPSVGPTVPLAVISTGLAGVAAVSGTYDFADIEDYRGLALLTSVGPLGAQPVALPLTAFRSGTLTALGAAGDGVSLGLAAGSHAAAGPMLESSLVSGSAVVERVRALVPLPPGYQPGTDVTLRVSARVGTAVEVSADLDAAVCRLEGAGDAGADVCVSPAAPLSTTWSDADFTLTGSGLSPGDVLDVELTVSLDDTGGSAGAKAYIGDARLLCATRN